VNVLEATRSKPELMLNSADNPEPTPSSGPGGPARIVVDGLTVTYPAYGRRPRPALSDICFSIAQGEIVGLVGESGSGKTTLARAIMGMVPEPGVVDRGNVLFDGVSISQMSEEKLRALRGAQISMMVPNPRSELNPVQTIGNQIARVALEHLGGGSKQAIALAKDMLRAVRIPDVERRFDAYPHELSGGMLQRVIIAIALICGPKFIISDDATSGLDVTVQAQVLALMSQLVKERNSSMLFITRDIGIAAHFCNRIMVMYAGQVVETAEINVFFARPMHPYSLMLLAAFSHNPSLRKVWTKETAHVAGSAIAQTGCTFRNRCVRAEERCTSEVPSMRELASGHHARCHFPIET
jgi:oligopeptide/dipeptide ABC transporter ATP-binding protein